MRISIIAFCIAAILRLEAQELRPWFTDSFIFYLNHNYEIEHFTRFDTDFGEEDSHNTTFAYIPSLQFTYADYTGEVEMSLCRTESLEFSSEYFAQTFRYLLTDDIRGDCFSSAVGTTYRQVSKQHLLDIAQTHHGRNELDFHYVIGKEWAPQYDWVLRGYTGGVFSVADHGSPWFRWLAGVDFHLFGNHLLALSSEWRMGFGNEVLVPAVFSGYGPIRYRTFDIKASYLHRLCDLDIGVWYRGRVYAKNAPEDLFAIGFELVYSYPL